MPPQQNHYSRLVSFVNGYLAESQRDARLVRQDAEQEEVTVAIRKLDKHTLNMYTSLRAELGTREPSWIRLAFSVIQASRNGKKFQEEWQQ